MGVKVVIGDIFESDAQTLINTVNCVGVMGKGVALAFKNRFPAMFEDYKRRCDKSQVRLGEPYIYKELTPPWIINFPTKQHWRMPSSLAAIERGLAFLKEHVNAWGVVSLASPPLGCGLGQLDWRVVGPTLYQGFASLSIPFQLFAPRDTPKEQMTLAFLDARKPVTSDSPAEGIHTVKPAMVAIVEAMQRIADTKFYHPGSVEFQKLAYFATVLGLPTGLAFQKGTYGPFCPELKQELVKLELNGLVTQTDIRGTIAHCVGSAYHQRIWRKQVVQWDSEINRLLDLFLRISSARQAELYATIHFTATEIESHIGQRPSESDVMNAVMEWKKRKAQPFGATEITDAIRLLNVLGWIDVSFSADLMLSHPSMVI